MSEEVAQLWENVRNSRNPLRWVVAVVNDKSTALTVVSSGTGGLTEFLAALGDTNGIVHAGLKVTGVDERGSVKSIRSQFVKVSMMTDDVPQLKRAKALQLKDSIDRAFAGASVVVDVSSAAEINKDDLARRLASAAGAHKPGRYDFEGVEDDLQGASEMSPRESQSPRRTEELSPKTPAPSSSSPNEKPRDEAPPAPASGAPAAAEPQPPAAPAPPSLEASPPPPTPPTPSAPVEEGPLTPEAAWARVHDEKHPCNFLVVTYDGKDTKTTEVVAAGAGDLNAFRAHFADDKPMYGGFRLRAIDDRGTVVSVRPKIVYVSMIGKHVKPTVRAQAGAVKPHFDNIFSGHHVHVFVAEAAELTEADVVQRLRQSGGAHQPNRYDFSGKKGQDV